MGLIVDIDAAFMAIYGYLWRNYSLIIRARLDGGLHTQQMGAGI